MLAQIVGKIGSSPWSIKELSQNLGRYKVVAALGMSVQEWGEEFVVSCVFSISNSLCKYTSQFYVGKDKYAGMRETLKKCFLTFYSTQKQMPEMVVCLRDVVEEKVDGEFELELYSECADEIMEKVRVEKNVKLVKPKMCSILSSSEKKLKYFLQHPNDL